MLTLSPAYGREYRSIKELKKNWDANKDFIVETIFSPFAGKLINKNNLYKVEGETTVKKIRYNKLRKTAVVNT